jgi:hypothetical protein
MVITTVYEWLKYSAETGTTNGQVDFLKLLLFTGLSLAVGLVSIRVFWPLRSVRLQNNCLVVRHFLSSINVPVAEITQVNGPDATSLRRITVEFNSTFAFGRSITFSPAMFKANSIAESLRSYAKD